MSRCDVSLFLEGTFEWAVIKEEDEEVKKIKTVPPEGKRKESSGEKYQPWAFFYVKRE